MIKFLVMDVDGTLTDGKIYMGENGELFKAFDVKDGCGIKDILPKHGIIPVIITARISKITENRCRELEITELYQGERNKLDKLLQIVSDYNKKNNTCFSLADCAYIGDDILDLPCMLKINEEGGLSMCPKDAVDSVKDVCNYISKKDCKNGAVRDCIEYIISNR